MSNYANRLNKSQNPNTISKINIGISNQPALTVESKWGYTMKVKAQNTPHTDEIIPNNANAFGIYLERKNK